MPSTSIRGMEKDDAQDLLSFFEKLVVQDPERVERKQDVDALSVEDEKEWIQSRNEREERGEIFTLIAEKNGEIVAEGEVERRSRWIEQHVAEMRFGMLPGNKEITAQMLEQLMQKADQNNIEVLIYFHLATQNAGIDLVERLEFGKVGTIEDYHKRGDEYADRVYYSKSL